MCGPAFSGSSAPLTRLLRRPCSPGRAIRRELHLSSLAPICLPTGNQLLKSHRGDEEFRWFLLRKNLRIRALDSHEEMDRPDLVLLLPKSCKECPVESCAALVR